MELKIKLSKLLDINGVVREYINDCNDVSSKFRLLGFLKNFENIISNYESLKQELFEKYGTRDEENGTLSINRKSDPDNYNNFLQEHNKLLDEEVTMNIDKIKLADVMNMDTSSLLLIYDIIQE